MKIWVIGDIHGCYRSLMALLEQLQLNSDDVVISIGDLINRGPDSESVLKLFSENAQFDSIIGNHELAFIRWFHSDRSRKIDDFEHIARQPYAERWLSWMRNRDVLKKIENTYLVHAGLWPHWTLEQNQEHADTLKYWIQSASQEDFDQIGSMFDLAITEPLKSEPYLLQISFYINVFLHMRFINVDDKSLHLARKDIPGLGEESIFESQPWYMIDSQFEKKLPKVVFGHWASLGGVSGPWYTGIDTGCVWGKGLTAYEVYSGLIKFQPALDKHIEIGG
ncbi:MAG: symmetrical bis(5'-nucleosyl)-tetraphosphatase [Gammaproteobacteria bacterium]|nr:symmetrical bis(5'-nucleosyl)-tetraphosphatase [Gammaproteobacteria bacterium]